MTPLTLSLKGCRDLSEAEGRIRGFVEQTVVNGLASFPPELARVVNEELPALADEIDRTVERMMAIVRAGRSAEWEQRDAD